VLQCAVVCVYYVANLVTRLVSVLQLQRVAVCCSVFQCVAVCVFHVAHTRDTTDERAAVAACCSVLQRVAVWCRV